MDRITPKIYMPPSGRNLTQKGNSNTKSDETRPSEIASIATPTLSIPLKTINRRKERSNTSSIFLASEDSSHLMWIVEPSSLTRKKELKKTKIKNQIHRQNTEESEIGRENRDSDYELFSEEISAIDHRVSFSFKEIQDTLMLIKTQIKLNQTLSFLHHDQSKRIQRIMNYLKPAPTSQVRCCGCSLF